jgi:hypothetical protein
LLRETETIGSDQARRPAKDLSQPAAIALCAEPVDSLGVSLLFWSLAVSSPLMVVLRTQ